MSSYRIVWIIITIISIPFAISFHDYVTNSNSFVISFSYYGTVATIIGLLITILEILYNIKTSKSIKEVVKNKIDKYESDEILWTSGTCIEITEKIIDFVGYGKFTDAKFLIRDLRKQLNRVAPELLNVKFDYIDGKKASLEQLELHIHSYEKSTARSPVSKPQLRGLCVALVELRTKLEASRSKIRQMGE